MLVDPINNQQSERDRLIFLRKTEDSPLFISSRVSGVDIPSGVDVDSWAMAMEMLDGSALLVPIFSGSCTMSLGASSTQRIRGYDQNGL
jgi:hypothetical protein